MSKAVSITTEGTTNLKIQTADKAGNLSQEKEISIKIDKTAPVFPNGIKTSKITETEMTVEALATDSISGGIKYKCAITKQGTTEPKTITNETGTFAYKNLEKGTRYNIEVIAEDNAGNKTSSITYAVTEGGTGGNQGGTETPNTRQAPEITITKGEGTPDPVNRILQRKNKHRNNRQRKQ